MNMNNINIIVDNINGLVKNFKKFETSLIKVNIN